MADIFVHDSTSLRTGESIAGNNTFTIVANVTTKIYPQSTFDYDSSFYSMDTNVVTQVYPEAAFTFTEGQPTNNFTLEGDGTSISLVWQESAPTATFAFDGDATLAFTQPDAELRFRQNSVILGNYGITFTPSASLLLIKTDYIDAQNSIRLTPSAEFNARARASLSGSNRIRLTPRVTLWAINGVVTGRRFVPGYFATKSAGSIDSASDTAVKLRASMDPLEIDIEGASINDLWMKFFDTRGIPNGSINDRMAYWLRQIKQVDGDSINDLMSNWNGIL